MSVKLTWLALLLLSPVAYAQTAEADRDNDAVANCLLTKQDASGKDAGPKLFLGFQFDLALRGSVAPDSVRFHDPNLLLGKRNVRKIKYDEKSILFEAFPDGETGADSSMIVVLQRGENPDPELFRGSLGQLVRGKPAMTYFGACSMKGYLKGSNRMFEAMLSEKPGAWSK